MENLFYIFDNEIVKLNYIDSRIDFKYNRIIIKCEHDDDDITDIVTKQYKRQRDVSNYPDWAVVPPYYFDMKINDVTYHKCTIADSYYGDDGLGYYYVREIEISFTYFTK